MAHDNTQIGEDRRQRPAPNTTRGQHRGRQHRPARGGPLLAETAEPRPPQTPTPASQQAERHWQQTKTQPTDQFSPAAAAPTEPPPLPATGQPVQGHLPHRRLPATPTPPAREEGSLLERGQPERRGHYWREDSQRGGVTTGERTAREEGSLLERGQPERRGHYWREDSQRGGVTTGDRTAREEGSLLERGQPEKRGHYWREDSQRAGVTTGDRTAKEEESLLERRRTGQPARTEGTQRPTTWPPPLRLQAGPPALCIAIPPPQGLVSAMNQVLPLPTPLPLRDPSFM